MEMPPFIQSFVDGPKLPKIVLGVALLVGILAGGYFLLISPVETRIAALETKVTAVEIELTQARAQVAELARFRREAAVLQARLVVLKDKLPTEKETPALYRTLSDAAQQSGLGVSLFQPRAAVAKEYVSEIPITVTAEGGYHQLGEFFEKVARLPRVVKVDTLKVTGLTKARTSLRADITLATYTYRAIPAAPAAKPGMPAPPAPKPSAALPSSESRS
ncbi:MAG: type 4a pilus biogenesis protein PilO [Candidatus Rokuibacteriota bacterium]